MSNQKWLLFFFAVNLSILWPIKRKYTLYYVIVRMDKFNINRMIFFIKIVFQMKYLLLKQDYLGLYHQN